MLQFLQKKPQTEITAEAADSYELKPEEVRTKLDKLDNLEVSVNELRAKSAVLDRMNQFLDSQEVEINKRKTAENVQRQNTSREELEELWLTDPAEAQRRVNAPLVEATVNTQAALIVRELLAENDNFEYGNDPTIKKEVNALVMSLPISQRTNVDSIQNCYYVALGRHNAEVKEGKIKSKLSNISSSGNGTGTAKGDSKDVIVLSEREKAAAKVFGLSETEYAESKRELSYV